jgi:hypothetical protein
VEELDGGAAPQRSSTRAASGSSARWRSSEGDSRHAGAAGETTGAGGGRQEGGLEAAGWKQRRGWRLRLQDWIGGGENFFR